MAYIATVTPGVVLSANEAVTTAKLNLLGNPTVTVTDDGNTVSTTTTVSSATNYLSNPAMQRERWLTGSMTLADGVDGYAQEYWWANAAGASTAVLARVQAAPTTDSLYCARVTGNTSITTVDFGQNIPQSVACEARREVTFSMDIYNSTGGAFIPKFFLDTCNSIDTFSDTSNAIEEDLASCPNGAWTRVSWTFDAADISNFENGVRVYLRVPSGSLDNSGKHVQFAQGQLAPGDGTTYVAGSTRPSVAGVAAFQFEELRIESLTEHTFKINATRLILKAENGTGIAVDLTDATVDLRNSGTSGLDTGSRAKSTWYYVWAVSNGVTHSAVASASATAPTLEAGYLWSARIGVLYNDDQSTAGYIHPFLQTGRTIYVEKYTTPLMDAQTFVGDLGGTLTVWQEYTTNLAAQLPPNAKEMFGIAGITVGATGTKANIALAGSADPIGPALILGSDVTGSGGLLEMEAGGNFRIPIITSQKIYITCGNNSEHTIHVTGYVI